MLNKPLKALVKCMGASLIPVLTLTAAPSQAVIQSPTSATASSDFSSEFGIIWTINQAGLLSPFSNGVDSFDAYMATNPLHSPTASQQEWFTPSGVTSATVRYDLGAIYSVDKFALWNEESSGIGFFDLSASADGSSFTTLLSGISPIDNPVISYPAQVFSLGVHARYFEFAISGCPQPDPGSFTGCGIGEVAFNVNPIDSAPVPGPLPLFGIGAAFVYSRKLRRRVYKAAKLQDS